MKSAAVSTKKTSRCGASASLLAALLLGSGGGGCVPQSELVMDEPQGMVYLEPAAFNLGSTTEQLERAAWLCSREIKAHGCTFAHYADERPRREVTHGPFWIDQYEATAAQYDACVRAGACQAAGVATYCTWKPATTSTLPINCVTWTQAAEYCRWEGKRLPTEVEWERAARGVDGREFPWGDDPPAAAAACVANIADEKGKSVNPVWSDFVPGYRDGFDGPAPVGTFAAGVSPSGAYDMAGNVAEWVADPYGSRVSLDAGGSASSAQPWLGRVVRGGSFASASADVRVSTRFAASSVGEYNTVGFRCASTPEPQRE